MSHTYRSEAMPKQTYFHLPKDKQDKLIEAAKKLEGKVPVSKKVDEARNIFKDFKKLSL